jgi:hypothetical protein
MSDESEIDDWELAYVLDLHRQRIGYEKGYWATFRFLRVPPDEGRPHGLQYSLSLHDENDDRLLGYNNAHLVDVGGGPSKKSRRPKEFDHINWRGKKPVPYKFTTPLNLLKDFFADVDKILKEEGVS